MRLGIMQPYFLPYLGYFQLLAAVDKMVLADDVQFIKGGWIASNTVLMGGERHEFSIPLRRHPHTARIHEFRPADGFRAWRRRFLKTVTHGYHDARNFAEIFPMLGEWLSDPDAPISAINARSIREICRWLRLPVEIVETSAGFANAHLRGTARLFDICRQERATTYVNSGGGRHLYRHAEFAQNGLTLRFVDPVLRPYPQASAEFIPSLSILDLIMRASRAEARSHVLAGQLELPRESPV
jgi:hypothetical protein